MKIEIVGGGPAGLYFAMLMKKHQPDHQIRVWEQNPPDATYGWGVVFSEVALSFLAEIDPEFFHDFTAGHERCDALEIVHRGTSVPVAGNGFSRVSRIRLLEVLHDHCRRAGVDIQFGRRINDVSEFADADLIVAADGINSAIRQQFADHFEPTIETRRNWFAWYGTRALFPNVSLIFRETGYGVFIAHAYQYAPDVSTFLVECDPETWKRAKLDTASEAESLALCGEIFADALGGEPLLSNRSTWFQAGVLRNRRWARGNLVLLGDALRSVHFSLGSGTRMAMQDAIALHRGFVAHGDDVAAALGAFEAARRPASDKFQDAAVRSLDWYETVGTRMDLDPLAFAYDYMMRTGRVDPRDLARRAPDFFKAYAASRAVA